MQNKETAQQDFIEMIKKSWTYGRLTEQEKGDCIRLLTDRTCRALKGTYSQRWEVLHAIYSGFLAGLGYFRNPVAWREENTESIPFSQA